MKIILKFKGDINVVENYRSTALHLICQQNFVAGLKLLLRLGVKIEVRGNDGKLQGKLKSKIKLIKPPLIVLPQIIIHLNRLNFCLMKTLLTLMKNFLKQHSDQSDA